MPTPIKALLAGLALLAAALAVAACGSGSNITTGEYVAKPPEVEDWPLFGRDQDNTRFATQGEIDTGNVGELGEAWSTDLGGGRRPAASNPLVLGEDVFLTTATGEVMSLDGRTGHVNWTYAPEVNSSRSTGNGHVVSVSSGVAAEGGRLFVLTGNGELQAISQKTGERLWSSPVADPTSGAHESTAPSVWDGKVFVGDSGAADGRRGFVAAYDAKTGKRIWRFYTVPEPGTGWVPKGGGGGAVYMPPTIDSRTGTVYVATGNPAPALVGAGRPGKSLYTDSLLALDAENGELLWYHQEQAHDLWDYGAASPALLFNAEIEGRRRRGIAEASKNGLLFLLDAKSGKDIFPSVAFVKRDHSPPTPEGALECPGAPGGSQLSPLAYSPETQAVYVSGANVCTVLEATHESTADGKKALVDRVVPRDTEKSGTFTAVSTVNGKVIWKREMPTPMDGGATATAGGLVFTGDQQGILYALDAKDGDDLWQADLKLAFGTAPVVYSIDGTEYVLATVGGAGPTAAKEPGEIGARVIAFKLGGKKLPTGPELKG